MRDLGASPPQKRTGDEVTMNAGDLTSTGYARNITIQDDGTDSATWINRWAIKFKEVGGLIRNTFALNEYGEIRVAPGKHNTVALRVFVKEFVDNPVQARSATVPVMEVMDNRNTRNSLWGIVGDGTTVVAGQRMSYVLVLATGAAVPAGTPANTVIVRI